MKSKSRKPQFQKFLLYVGNGIIFCLRYNQIYHFLEIGFPKLGFDYACYLIDDFFIPCMKKENQSDQELKKRLRAQCRAALGRGKTKRFWLKLEGIQKREFNQGLKKINKTMFIEKTTKFKRIMR